MKPIDKYTNFRNNYSRKGYQTTQRPEDDINYYNNILKNQGFANRAPSQQSENPSQRERGPIEKKLMQQMELIDSDDEPYTSKSSSSSSESSDEAEFSDESNTEKEKSNSEDFNKTKKQKSSNTTKIKFENKNKSKLIQQNKENAQENNLAQNYKSAQAQAHTNNINNNLFAIKDGSSNLNIHKNINNNNISSINSNNIHQKNFNNLNNIKGNKALNNNGTGDNDKKIANQFTNKITPDFAKIKIGSHNKNHDSSINKEKENAIKSGNPKIFSSNLSNYKENSAMNIINTSINENPFIVEAEALANKYPAKGEELMNPDLVRWMKAPLYVKKAPISSSSSSLDESSESSDFITESEHSVSLKTQANKLQFPDNINKNPLIEPAKDKNEANANKPVQANLMDIVDEEGKKKDNYEDNLNKALIRNKQAKNDQLKQKPPEDIYLKAAEQANKNNRLENANNSENQKDNKNKNAKNIQSNNNIADNYNSSSIPELNYQEDHENLENFNMDIVKREIKYKKFNFYNINNNYLTYLEYKHFVKIIF